MKTIVSFDHLSVFMRSPAGRTMLTLCLLALVWLVQAPAFADTTGTLDTVTDTTDSILDTVNAILRPLSILAIIALGVAGGFGKMEWGTVGKATAGLVIANSAVTIIDWLSVGTTAT